MYAGIDALRQTASYNEFSHEMYLLLPEILDW